MSSTSSLNPLVLEKGARDRHEKTNFNMAALA